MTLAFKPNKLSWLFGCSGLLGLLGCLGVSGTAWMKNTEGSGNNVGTPMPLTLASTSQESQVIEKEGEEKEIVGPFINLCSNWKQEGDEWNQKSVDKICP